ncbi:MAG: ubiquitin-like domain-containing protein [Anaerolineae bacterium]
MNVLRRARDVVARIAFRLLRFPWRSGIALGLLVGGGYLATLYGQTRNAIRIDVNGAGIVHYTQRRAAEDVFRELDVELGPADTLVLPTTDELLSGTPIRMSIARRVVVMHDGRLTEVLMRDSDLVRALAESGIALRPDDELWTPEGPLGSVPGFADLVRPQRMSLSAWIDKIRMPLFVTIVRSATVTVTDDGVPSTLKSTADTVGEALAQASIAVYEGDRVVPALESRLVPNLSINIDRARPVTVDADGRVRAFRTRASSVGELLDEAGVRLEGDDRVSPEGSAPLAAGMRVSVVRVYDEYYVAEVPIPYETRWEPNPELEIDQKRTASWGREGALRQQVRVHYENGAEVSRIEEDAWVAREPEARIIEYGTGIVIRQLETSSGTLEYWRKIRMLATSYNAATAGTPLSSPTFGYTRLGEPARKGVIAVDPTVIPMRQPMYVPGYGTGFAGDTGSAIKNRRVDLCYDDDNLEMWYRWVDVYLLTPVPPSSRITWIVPNTPAERE